MVSKRLRRGVERMRGLSVSKAMLMRRLLGLVVFLSFLGGPLYLADPLKQRIGSWQALLITCWPLGLMLFASYSMVDAAVDRLPPSRAIVWAGLLGMVITLGMHIYALCGLALGLGTSNAPFHAIGIPVGLVWSLVHWRQSRRWLSASGGSSSPGDPSSPKPIEPS